jgi:hypothetical protein
LFCTKKVKVLLSLGLATIFLRVEESGSNAAHIIILVTLWWQLFWQVHATAASCTPEDTADWLDGWMLSGDSTNSYKPKFRHPTHSRSHQQVIY